MNEVARPTGLAPLTPITPIIPQGAVPLSRRASGHEPMARSRLGSNVDTRPLRSSLLAFEGAQLGQDISDVLSESALEGSDDEDEDEVRGPPNTALPPANSGRGGESVPDSPSTATSPTVSETTSTPRDSDVKPPSSDALPSPPITPTADGTPSAGEPLPAIPPALVRRLSSTSGSPLVHGSDLAAQLSNNPKLAALRSPPSGLNMPVLTSPNPGTSSPGPGVAPLSRSGSTLNIISPPLLANNTCSGYFVEPMKWMDAFLQDGQMAGKIVCPNKRCGAKLGNYDWAGVCCSCKQWVVPVSGVLGSCSGWDAELGCAA